MFPYGLNRGTADMVVKNPPYTGSDKYIATLFTWNLQAYSKQLTEE